MSTSIHPRDIYNQPMHRRVTQPPAAASAAAAAAASGGGGQVVASHPTFDGQIILAIFVMACCNFPFGLVAAILAGQ